MMKRFLSVMLVGMFLILSLTGCNQKIPDGIENKEFYKDMVSILPLLKINLENQKIIDEQSDVLKNIFKYIKTDMKIEKSDHENDMLNITRFIKDGINQKEADILQLAYNILIQYNKYIDYKKRNSVKILKDKLIDEENIYSTNLKEYLNNFIKALEINYEIK
jgi:hypothetical protein